MKKRLPYLAFLTLFITISPGAAESPGEKIIPRPVQGRHAMVVTGQELATRAGFEVLKNGGNAVDAAVTVALTLAVTLPQAGNIGGGGFMLIYRAQSREMVAIDYREKAPAASTRDMFLDRFGRADSKLSGASHAAVGVPGTVAGLALALEKYGTISLARAMEPAIKHARDGFVLTSQAAAGLAAEAKILNKFPATARLFCRPDGKPRQAGDLFVQKDLAGTLTTLAQEGPLAFYDGRIAEMIVAQMRRNGGLITREDLRGYRPVIREPIRGTYRGYAIYSMPPPSSGGVHIVEILNTMEKYDLHSWGFSSTRSTHHLAEAMKLAFADRAQYLGDPDFVPVPIHGLLSKKYADLLRTRIDPLRARPAAEIQPGPAPAHESDQTTHFSIVDRDGNAVANTYTLNTAFGSGLVVEGAGFLLNNEMDDFSAKPGTPNHYGLTGGEANAIAPGKRMLSSMAPCIILKDGRLFMVTGSPGGPKIITATLQVIMNVIDHGMNIQEAVDAPRVHHQWLPDELRIEKGFPSATIAGLKALGHGIKTTGPMGSVASILVDPPTGTRFGAADHRGDGLALGY